MNKKDFLKGYECACKGIKAIFEGDEKITKQIDEEFEKFKNDFDNVNEADTEYLALLELAKDSCPVLNECPCDFDPNIVNPDYCAKCWQNFLASKGKEMVDTEELDLPVYIDELEIDNTGGENA